MVKPPSTNPMCYKTMKGLVCAYERALRARKCGYTRFTGMSYGMWLYNAEYAARTNFGSDTVLHDLKRKYSSTRLQDLTDDCLSSGSPIFCLVDPKSIARRYTIGDNVPGVGEIVDEYDTGDGWQFKIGNQWYHERALE